MSRDQFVYLISFIAFTQYMTWFGLLRITNPTDPKWAKRLACWFAILIALVASYCVALNVEAWFR